VAFVQEFVAERFWPHVVVVAHSLTSPQLNVVPLPVVVYPGVHVHEKAPTVFVQAFNDERLRPQALVAVHSLTSTHEAERPLPEAWKPVAQPHE
jgi:hypothetical protein